MSKSKIIIIAGLAVLISAFFLFDLGQYFTLQYLKAEKDDILAFYELHKLGTIVIYMLLYVGITALSLPGAAIMTLAGGAIFGLFTGSLIVSFASTIGATLAFLVSRF
ncbi:MAG TPA: TVP38/TMEM64 family protein, partial [Gammaproteobacteria bacterium]|nr:TVP38/TMEM64 family protein [Gammaproteobacteria bacterium]